MKTAVTVSSLVLAIALSATGALAANPSLDTATQALAAGKWKKSVFWSQKALRTPNVSTADTLAALTALCVGQTKLGRFAQADATCNKTVAAAPAEWSGYLNRGNLRAMIGDTHGARADYARAQALNPAHPATQAAAQMKTIPPLAFTPSFIAFGAGGSAVAQAAATGKTAAGQ